MHGARARPQGSPSRSDEAHHEEHQVNPCTHNIW
jgi:hypothetical protein